MWIVQVIVVMGIASDTLARIGVVKVAEVGEQKMESDEDKEYEDKTCPSYDKMIAPKIAQNINGKYIQHTCSSHGSSCLGCLPLDMDHQHSMYLKRCASRRTTAAEDNFLIPDGCKCTSR
jgi:hypothetical protein